MEIEALEVFAPSIHIDRMGVGNTVMKIGMRRDELTKADEIIVFEMERAGVWDYFPNLVIKGVYDYAAAAACAKRS